MPDRLDIRDVRRVIGVGVPADIEGRARRAAVSTVLREAGPDLEVLLIRRAIRDGDPWSGHMALPGGNEAPSDRELRVTAVRETMEEVGLDLDLAGEYIGRLDDFVPARQFDISVRPFVFYVPEPRELTLSDEVREALWVPLGALLSGAHRATFEFDRGGEILRLPAWDIRGRVVWGLTYRVLSVLLERLTTTTAMDSESGKR